MSEQAKLRVGVIGVGIGRMHIEQYKKHPQVEVVAIAEPDVARADWAKSEFNVTAYPSGTEMLAKESLDIVSVCTPNKFHKPLTIEALEAGCHVLCEKPMAMNAEESAEMLEVAKRTGKRLMINFSYRFTEQATALKQQVDAGILGEIYFGRTVWLRRRGMPKFGGWFGIKEMSGGGPLIDLGVHRLDLALWLMNYPKPKWVMGSAYNPIASALAKAQGKEFDVEDFAAAMIKFENGASLEVEASWASNIAESELMETRLLGTKAGLVQRNVGEGYQFEAVIYEERNGAQYDIHLHPPVPAAKSAQLHYVDSILNDEPHEASGEDGHTVMQLLDAIYASNESGVPVEIK